MNEHLLQAVQHGLGGHDFAIATLRVAVGSFFACSGANKLRNKQRHAALVDTLQKDHVPYVAFNQWWVPANELVGGIAVMLGIAPAAFAAVLLVICVVACRAEGKQRVEAYRPINVADRWADWCYLPEVLYAVMLVVIIACGGGAFSLGNVLF